MTSTIIGTRISASGQTTIPTFVRKKLKTDIGSTIYWLIGENGIASVSSSPSENFNSSDNSSDAQAAAQMVSRMAEQATSKTPTKNETATNGQPTGQLNNEWPSSFWATIGALDDPSFELDRTQEDEPYRFKILD